MKKLNRNVCAVPGCSSKRCKKKEIPIHLFPKKYIGRQWVALIGNKDLKGISYDEVTSNHLFICRLHFSEDQMNKCQDGTMRLKSDAVPTLNLPEVEEVESGADDEADGTKKLDLSNRKTDSSSTKIEPILNSPSLGKLRFVSEMMETNSIQDEVRKSSILYQANEREIAMAEMEIADLEVNVPPPMGTSTPKRDEKSESSANEIPTETLPKESVQTEFSNKEETCLTSTPKRYQERIKHVESMLKTDRYESLSKNLSTVERLFVDMIIKNHDKHPNGRRFSAEEKIIALSIYTKSAKCYRYLQTLIPLPARSTLKTVLKKVSMDTGIAESTRQRLKEAASLVKNEKNRVVILIWDEILLGLGLHYDSESDKIVGFEDWGTVRTDKFADHALVFMIRSIETGDNLPICFNFCDAVTKSDQLQCRIKEVVEAVKEAGFNIVASVCDGAATNDAAIKQMVQDTIDIRGEDYVVANGTYVIHGVEIIPLFDPPHLLKCIRNNLLDKDLEFGWTPGKTSDRKFAKWEHLVTAYEINVHGIRKVRGLVKLTDQHVYPDLIKRQTCKLANQVFSTDVASGLQSLAGCPAWETTLPAPRNILSLPIEARHTGEVFGYLNVMTDAFNGKVRYDERSQNRTLWTDSSFHMDFFSDARKKVSQWRFVNPVDKEPTPRQPPCLINLSRALKGFQLLWATLKKLGFTTFKTKHCNQDPIENLFGLIRANGGQSNKPTCYQFIGHFKALVINNLTHYHALGANCEDDEGASLLAWQSYLEFVDESSESTPWPEGKPQNPSSAPKIAGSKNPIPEKGNVLATTALMLKSLKTKCAFLDSYPICSSLLSCDNGSNYQRTKSVSPIQEIHREVNGILSRIMDSIYSKQGVQKYATNFLSREIGFDVVTCRIHKDALISNFYKCSIELHTLSTTSYLNRILRGKLRLDDPAENVNKEKANGCNIFVQAAVAKRQKSLHKKNMTVNKLTKVR